MFVDEVRTRQEWQASWGLWSTILKMLWRRLPLYMLWKKRSSIRKQKRTVSRKQKNGQGGDFLETWVTGVSENSWLGGFRWNNCCVDSTDKLHHHSTPPKAPSHCYPRFFNLSQLLSVPTSILFLSRSEHWRPYFTRSKTPKHTPISVYQSDTEYNTDIFSYIYFQWNSTRRQFVLTSIRVSPSSLQQTFYLRFAKNSPPPFLTKISISPRYSLLLKYLPLSTCAKLLRALHRVDPIP